MEVLIVTFLTTSDEQYMPSSKLKNSEKTQNQTTDENEVTTVKYLVESLQAAQRENELLKTQLQKSRKTTGKIGFPLLIIGALALIGSLVTSSTILAFIGLGLTFWGILFFFVKPVKFVRGALLDSTIISSYATIDRIISDLGYKGKALYVPPYPKDVYIPDYLKGLKELVALISAEDTTAMPTIEEMAKRQFLVENPKGICITPPGFGIMSMLEEEVGIDFGKINRESLAEILSKLITTNLELAGNVEIYDEKNLMHVKIEDSVYTNLYSPEHGLKSVHLLGCPLASTIACALSKASGKLVTIVKDEVSPDLKTIEVWYQTLEG